MTEIASKANYSIYDLETRIVVMQDMIFPMGHKPKSLKTGCKILQKLFNLFSLRFIIYSII